MIYSLTVPSTIEDTQEVRVLEWHGGPGQQFAPGELIVEMETHKVVIEARAGQRSVLRTILCQAGAWQALGQPLALLSDEPDEPVPDVITDVVESWPVAFEIV